jgi:hypothetical protein
VLYTKRWNSDSHGQTAGHEIKPEGEVGVYGAVRRTVCYRWNYSTTVLLVKVHLSHTLERSSPGLRTIPKPKSG